MALPSSRVITLIDIGLSVSEHYIQFVPPATFGVIYDSAEETIQLVRANGERTQLRKTADKIYTLRGFLGLRRRESRDLELRCAVEDEIIRRVLTSFGSSESLHAAVRRFCPNSENAETITQLWAPEVFDIQGDENREQEHDSVHSSAEFSFLPPANPEFANFGVFPIAPYMERAAAASIFAPIQENPFLTKSSKIGKESDPYTATSLQEFEEYTLPLTASLNLSPFHPQSLTDNMHLIESHTSNLVGCVTEASGPGFQTSIDGMGESAELSAYEQTRPQISNITSSRNRTDYRYPRTAKLPLPIPTLFPSHPQLSQAQASTASGLLQEPAQFRIREHLEQSKMLPISYRGTESEILIEIQTMVALEVLRARFSSFDASPNARCPSSDRKIHIANSLISKLELPQDYFIVGKFYRAIDAGIEDYTGRMKEFFINEGLVYKGFHPQEDYTHAFPAETVSNHACNACDQCLKRFFGHVELSNIIALTDLLNDFYFRARIVKLYRCALQLGIKAAWDPTWKERGFDRAFYSLDKFTANMEFSGRSTGVGECGTQKQRKLSY